MKKEARVGKFFGDAARGLDNFLAGMARRGSDDALRAANKVGLGGGAERAGYSVAGAPEKVLRGMGRGTKKTLKWGAGGAAGLYAFNRLTD